MNANKLKKVIEIENYSGISLSKLHGKIKPVQQGNYRILDIQISGDAPKDFIQLYTYGEGKKATIKAWPKYIAKVGKKWYPIESVVEYLLNRIGETMNLNMAKSSLRLVDGQLRFLSKYFLKKGEELIHGAQIFSSYLEDTDQSFVEEIEQQGMAREFFTFQFVVKTIVDNYPTQAETIINDFVKLLVFDAITGNNDRHFYNWGVITSFGERKKPVFSPIYDTARGLFWNYSEQKISKLFQGKTGINQVQFMKYVNNSKPKTGWDGRKDLNHFELIQLINAHYPDYAQTCAELLKNVNLSKVMLMIDQEFKPFFSRQRYKLVTTCLEYRFNHLKNICNCI